MSNTFDSLALGAGEGEEAAENTGGQRRESGQGCCTPSDHSPQLWARTTAALAPPGLPQDGDDHPAWGRQAECG